MYFFKYKELASPHFVAYIVSMEVTIHGTGAVFCYNCRSVRFFRGVYAFFYGVYALLSGANK